jgi:hypothetical protein
MSFWTIVATCSWRFMGAADCVVRRPRRIERFLSVEVISICVST